MVTVRVAPGRERHGPRHEDPGSLIDALEATLRIRDGLDRRPPERRGFGQGGLDGHADVVVALRERCDRVARPAAVVAVTDAAGLEPRRRIAATAEQHDRPLESEDRVHDPIGVVRDIHRQGQRRRPAVATDRDRSSSRGRPRSRPSHRARRRLGRAREPSARRRHRWRRRARRPCLRPNLPGSCLERGNARGPTDARTGRSGVGRRARPPWSARRHGSTPARRTASPRAPAGWSASAASWSRSVWW